MLPQPHGNSEQIGKMLLGKDRGLRPIGKDASCAQEDHAFDLWKDLGYMVRHQQDPEPGLSKLAHGVSKLDLRADVQRIARLIKKQRLWIVHQRPRDQRPLGFPGGHLGDRAIGKMPNAKPPQSFFRSREKFRIGMMVRKNARAAEETREYYITAGGIRGAGSQQVRRHDSQQRAQLENIPSFASQYGNAGPFPREGITLPRNGLDQCRFAAAIRPQDAHVLPARDLQVHVLEGRAVATHYGDMRKGEQGRREGVHSGLNGIDRRFVVARTDDTAMLTEHGCEVRDQGKPIREEVTKPACKRVGRKVCMFHFETADRPGSARK